MGWMAQIITHLYKPINCPRMYDEKKQDKLATVRRGWETAQEGAWWEKVWWSRWDEKYYEISEFLLDMLLTSPGQCLAWADWLSSQAVYITKRQRWPHLFKLVAFSSCCYFPFVFLGSKSDNRMEFRGAAQRFHQVLPGQTGPNITCPYF